MAVQSTARVVVLTRAGCHLCSAAEQVIETVCRDTGVSWQAVDVDSDADLRARWNDHVPVTFVDGRQVAQWFLEADALLAALAS